MELKGDDPKKREMNYSHLYHSLLPIIFIIFGILDLNIFHISTWLKNLIPLLFQIFLFVIFLCLGLLLILLSHKALFHKNAPQNRLLTEGVFNYIRHPLYLGILLIYIAFIFFISFYTVYHFLLFYLYNL